ncbi:ferredoxin [Pseudofrankia asymbiotica]|uniref:ferredoxin n=1 Tax=Pseudofrankia asymbiotica TaxID=1834516 RepID=UPI0009757AFC
MHTVVVDRDRCAGNGICEVLDPAHFEIGKNGALIILSPSVAPADLSRVHAAVEACPASALRVD